MSGGAYGHRITIATGIRPLIAALWLACMSAAGAQSPVPGPKEPDAPTPGARVQKLQIRVSAEFAASQWEAALKTADTMVTTALADNDLPGEARSYRAKAKILERLNRMEEALSAWRMTLEAWKRVGDGPACCEAIAMLGLLQEGTKPGEARALVAEAARLGASEPRRPIAAADILNIVGAQAGNRGLFNEAMLLFTAALSLREKRAPGSPLVLDSLQNLSYAAYKLGDLTAASDYDRRALDLQEKLTPDSPDIADTLHDLGGICYQRGDLAAAESYFRRVLDLREKVAPGSAENAPCLNDMGAVAWQRGDLAAAESFYQRSFALIKGRAMESQDAADVLNNLGLVAYERGSLDVAEDYLRRSLAIRQKLTPDSPGVAGTLNNLSVVARQRHDLTTASAMLRRGLAIQERLAPGSLAVADILNNLGAVAFDRGDLIGAEAAFRRGLAIRQRQAPDALALADILNNLSSVALRQNDVGHALILAQKGWNIVQRLAAGLGGDETRQAFGERNANYASQLIDFQLALHRSEDALRTLEQSRARSLQQLLTERRLLQNANSGDAFDRYQNAGKAHNRAIQILDLAYVQKGLAERELQHARHEKATLDRLAPLEHGVAQARQQVQQAAAEEARTRVEAEGRYIDFLKSAARAIPAPVPADEALKMLPADSLFVAFAVGKEKTHLFLLQRDRPVRTFTIRIAQKALVDQVKALQAAASTPVSDRDEVSAAGRKLFTTLFPPAARKSLLTARRLIISPDDMLWEAPFAALVTNSAGAPQWLGLQRALTYASSLTLFAQSRQARPALAQGAAPMALVVGDPLFQRSGLAANTSAAAARLQAGGDAERHYLWGSDTPPAPLPATREEASRISALFGAVPLLGVDATEANVRIRMGQADIVHFATHGVLRREVPTASGILLTSPETPPVSTDNDGALQAWELFGMKLKAELVTLSACETGRGVNRRGEGLLGLTRALAVAGSRSSLTSQWRVSDGSTAQLMEDLYRRLRAGSSKDEALRQAMQRAAAERAHPFYWAAFVLSGDPDNPNLGAARP